MGPHFRFVGFRQTQAEISKKPFYDPTRGVTEEAF